MNKKEIKQSIRKIIRKNHFFATLLDIRIMLKTNKKMISELGEGKGEILYFQNLGDLNPDKYIYLTGFSDCGVSLGGICGILRKDLIELDFIDKFNLTPVIEYRNSVLTEKNPINGTTNAFEYYYEQISGISPEDALKSRHVCIHRDANALCRDIPFNYDITDEHLERLGKIYNKYFKLNNKTEKAINDDIKALFNNKPTLGVNIRGTDFNRGYDGHPVAVKAEQLMSHIDEIIEKRNIGQIFIATDDQRLLEEFVNRYGDKALYFKDVHREKSDEPVMHVNYLENEDGIKYRGGYECLRDVYALVACDSLVAGFSGVEAMAQIIKKSKDESYYDRRIVSNGIYVHGKDPMVHPNR